MPYVSIVRVKSNNYRTAVFQALDSLHTDKFEKVGSVLIKPNLCHYYSPDTGITTDVRIVSHLIDYIRDRTSNNVKIIVGEADATEMKADIALGLLGYKRMAEKKKVDLLNLSKDRKLKVNGRIVKEIPAVIREVDLLVTVPKLKTHTDVKMTCCLKNQFGAIPYWKKSVFHRMINKAIVEATMFMRPHLCLVDGVVALEGMGPISQGTPLRMNLIVAGDDPVATDSVCSRIMGISKVKYLELAEKARLGSTKNIEILGESIDSVKRKFKMMTPTSKLAMYATRHNLGSLAYFLERFSKGRKTY